MKGVGMQNGLKQRTKKFHWETRQDLYSFFKECRGIEAEDLDARIEKAIQTFRLRQGQAIKTMELWQKVGMELVCQLGIVLPSDDASEKENPSAPDSASAKLPKSTGNDEEFLAEVDIP